MNASRREIQGSIGQEAGIGESPEIILQKEVNMVVLTEKKRLRWQGHDTENTEDIWELVKI